MTTITILKNHDWEYAGFDTFGHAGYADEGEDIVCAGISALVLNAINSIESFTKDGFTADQDQENGDIRFRFTQMPSSDSILLMKSLILGLQEIQNFYGNEYISLIFKEV